VPPFTSDYTQATPDAVGADYGCGGRKILRIEWVEDFRRSAAGGFLNQEE
jgi:hypothetical protein